MRKEVPNMSSDYKAVAKGESVFIGSTLEFIGISIAYGFLFCITLGIAFPWLECWRYRWEIDNKYIDGSKLYFDGTGAQLFGKYIIWWLLSIITFGIYALFVPVKIKKWITSHTHLMKVSETPEHKAAKKVCPNCSEGISVSERYCPRCGCDTESGQVPSRGRKCPYCESSLPEGASSCPACGKILYGGAGKRTKPNVPKPPVNSGWNTPSDDDL